MATTTEAKDHQPPPPLNVGIASIGLGLANVGIGGEPSESPVQTLMMRRMSAATASSAHSNPHRRASNAANTMMTALAAVKAEAAGDGADTNPGSGTGGPPGGDPDAIQLQDLRRVPTYLQPSLPWRKRLLHFTFAWYTVTMSTSGISLILALTPHRFPGLSTIGLIIYLLDLLFFLFITAAIALRFVLYQHAFTRAFTHPSEALFIPTFFLSIAAILSNMAEYSRLFLPDRGAGSGMAGFLKVAFWIYLGVTFGFSVFEYHLLFAVKEERRLQVSAMTPAWILPIFPVMLAGTLAGATVKFQEGEGEARQALAIVVAGLAAQGLGMLVSVFFYATYLSRLMAFGLPVQRPGMFIAVGPPSFTCAALVGMADQVPRILRGLEGERQVGWLLGGAGSGDMETVATGVKLLAISAAVFTWGLSFWFFVSAAAAVVAGMPDRRFHLSWWSFVFPNVGFVMSTIRIGTAFGSEGLLWLSSVMTVCLVIAWAFIAVRCLRAVHRREIMWPGHDEDSS